MASLDGTQKFLAVEAEATELVETLRRLHGQTQRYRDASDALEETVAAVTSASVQITEATTQLGALITSLEQVGVPALEQTRLVVAEQLGALGQARGDLDAMLSGLRLAQSSLSATGGHVAELAAELSALRGESESFTDINRRLSEVVAQLAGLTAEVSGTAAAVRGVSTTIREHGSPAVLQAYRVIEDRIHEVHQTQKDLFALQATLASTNGVLSETAESVIETLISHHETVSGQYALLEQRIQTLGESHLAGQASLAQLVHRYQVRLLLVTLGTGVAVAFVVGLLMTLI